MIEKNALNVVVRYWFGYIRSTMMLFEIDCILLHLNGGLFVYIIYIDKLNLRLSIQHEMTIRAN